MVLGRGGLDPALGGGDDDPRPDRVEALLDEALHAIAVVASRLQAERQHSTRLAQQVEHLEGSLGLMEERLDEVVAVIQELLGGLR